MNEFLDIWLFKSGRIPEFHNLFAKDKIELWAGERSLKGKL